MSSLLGFKGLTTKAKKYEVSMPSLLLKRYTANKAMIVRNGLNFLSCIRLNQDYVLSQLLLTVGDFSMFLLEDSYSHQCVIIPKSPNF